MSGSQFESRALDYRQHAGARWPFLLSHLPAHESARANVALGTGDHVHDVERFAGKAFAEASVERRSTRRRSGFDTMTLASTISSSDAVRSLEAGALDGLTILRYAHAYESGGGVEQYLYDVNRALGERNRCTIIQMQLTTSRERAAETEERVGTARVIKVPLLVQERAIGGVEKSSALIAAKNFIRDRMLFVPGIFHVITKPLLRDRPVPRRAGGPENTRNRITELAIRFRVNLIVLHTCGGADVSEILDVAEARNIPVALVHHFSNDRLRHFSVRQQTMHARAIGGVSD